MAVRKERRAAPRTPGSGSGATKSDRTITGNATPLAEQPSPEDVRRRIEMQAYLKAKARGFAPGYELQDWLEAEREVKSRQ